MTYLKSWEEFEKAAEKLYLQAPWKARYTMKYVHSKNQLILKMTDDVVVSFKYCNESIVHRKLANIISVLTVQD